MEVPRALVDRFMAVTNCDAEVATEQLRANDLDVEAAVANYFAIIEAGGDVQPRGSQESASGRRGGAQTRADDVVDIDGWASASTDRMNEDENRSGDGEVRVDDLEGDGDSRDSNVDRALEASRRSFEEGGIDRALEASRRSFEESGVDRALEESRRSFEEGAFDRVLEASRRAYEESAGRVADRGTSLGRGLGNSRVLADLAGTMGRGGTGVFGRQDGVFGRSWHEGHEGLAAMYRKPTDISFQGDWDTVLKEGVIQKKWILVNMQDESIFDCHKLNRDVWSDEVIRELIRVHFLLWQKYSSTVDGRNYKQFYPYTHLPHVALVDPRSGERLVVWGEEGKDITKDEILAGLVEFVDKHDLENHAAGSMTKTETASTSRQREKEYGLHTTEDAQLAAAIAASMEHANGSTSPAPPLTVTPREQTRRASSLLSAANPSLNRDRSIRAQQDSEYEHALAIDRAKAESEKLERERMERKAKEKAKARDFAEARKRARSARVPAPPPEGSSKKSTELIIRLPNGQRLQRRFYAADTIGNLYDYVESECDGLQENSYAIITPYPRRSFTDRDMTLKEADLCPKAALVVHEK